MPPPDRDIPRRAFLGQSAGGVGALALSQLLYETDSLVAGNGRQNGPGREGTAKNVICLFQHGGPSQMDLFDFKPALSKWDGQPYPGGDLETHFHEQMGNVLASPYRFSPQGDCGMELSDLLPFTSQIADDITLVRSMTTESVDHESALRLIHSGRFFAGMPAWGSWVVYALGSENRNMPAYVVLSDPGGLPVDGERNWSAGWLPAAYQGTQFHSGKSAVPNLNVPEGVLPAGRKNQLDLLATLNQAHLERHPYNTELAARLENFEIAARMQLAVPKILDVRNETAATRDLYGLDHPSTAEYGQRCLLARRLIERGVRFVQIYLNGQPWDTHTKNAKTLKTLCGRTDQPAAALVKDLKLRGLLDSTIVLWTGEFGRLPISQGKDGRDHNRHGFSLWLAGGGFRAGYVHGATDEFGYRAIEKTVSVHDLHATLLHALGIDHHRLALPRDGRETSLTDAEVTSASVVEDLLA